jgi:hypothetical protein
MPKHQLASYVSVRVSVCVSVENKKCPLRGGSNQEIQDIKEPLKRAFQPV